MTSRRLSDPERQTTRTVVPRWVPSPLARRLATAGCLSLAAAALVQNAALVAFGAPALVALAWWLRETRAGRADVTMDLPSPRTTERQTVDLRVRMTADGPVGSWRLALRPEEFVGNDGAVLATLTAEAESSWRVTPVRWGYWTAGTVVGSVRSAQRAWSADVVLEAPSLTVYPPASQASHVPPPPHLQSRLGPHVSRAPGAGVEFAGVRPYLPGDPVRRVNWSMSSRLHGLGSDDLMLNEFAQERMGDVVVLIDSVHDLGVPGRTTVDESVRGATAVVQAYLEVADRVGVVAFGSSLRWLAPTTGTRHFYRIVETLLAARQARTYVDPSVDRLPLAVLPSGALVVCFSPLVDALAVETVRDLRERAHPVVVVDVLTETDIHPESADDELALRVWRLERAAVTSSLERIGARVVPFAEVAEGSLGWLRLGGRGVGVRR
ncbi:MAG: DUF58 domain-containing protein [Nocardioidaceae bacterium]